MSFGLNPGTGVDVIIGDKRYWNIPTFVVQEDATPIDPGSSAGAFGNISVSIPDSPEVKRLGGKAITLTDGTQGQTVGIIRGRSGNGLTAKIEADSRLSALSAIRTATPYQGTLYGAIEYYFALCGITSGYVIDNTFMNIPVVLPGWRENVYDQMKKLGVAYKFEVSLVSGNVVARRLRGRVAENYRDASVTWTVDEQQLAQSVEGIYHTTEWRQNALVYPPGGWNEDVMVYSVDAGDTVEVDLEIDASLVSVQQPVCVSNVDLHHSTSSVYTVSGNDGKIIPPAQWLNDGGSVSVEINEDARSLKLIIKGAHSEHYAPYSIAMAAGTSNAYSSLRIVGTGAFITKGTITLPGHLDPDRAPDEVGQEIDNEFFTSPERLYHALLRASDRFAHGRQTITVTTKGINRKGESGSYVYPTIGDLKEMYPGATIGDMRAELGPTIGDWNTALFALVQSDFANQAFGNIAGARVFHEGSWYRIYSATTSAGSVQYQAERDNTISDVYRHDATIGAWNRRWEGKTIADVNAAPLEGLPVDEPLGFGFSPFGMAPFGF